MCISEASPSGTLLALLNVRYSVGGRGWEEREVKDSSKRKSKEKENEGVKSEEKENEEDAFLRRNQNNAGAHSSPKSPLHQSWQVGPSSVCQRGSQCIKYKERTTCSQLSHSPSCSKSPPWSCSTYCHSVHAMCTYSGATSCDASCSYYTQSLESSSYRNHLCTRQVSSPCYSHLQPTSRSTHALILSSHTNLHVSLLLHTARVSSNILHALSHPERPFCPTRRLSPYASSI